MNNRSEPFLKSEYCLPFLLSLLSFTLYSITLSPTINFGDSPELISAAYSLGIAHPPGYPLYSLAGKLFSLLPTGESIAGRVNLTSALFAAGSIFLVSLIVSRAGDKVSRLGAVFSAIALAISPALWSQSVITEVYTLNLFLFCLLICLIQLWLVNKDDRLLIAAAFLCGLGLGNHHTLVAFAPLLFLLPLLGKGEKLKRFKLYLPLTIFFLFGLTIYIYLPLRSLQSPPLDWGDPETLERFLDVVARRQFPTGEGVLTAAGAAGHLGWYVKKLSAELTLPILITALWGKINLLRRKPLHAIFLAFLFLVYGIGTLLFLNPSKESYPDVEVMLIPSFAVVSVFSGMGVGRAASLVRNRWWLSSFALALSAVILYPSFGTFMTNSHRNDYFALDYADNILKSVEQKGIIFVESDNTLFPLWYLQQVEEKRPDVAVVDADFLMLPWFKNQLMERHPDIDIRVEDIGKHAAGTLKGRDFSEIMDAYKVGQVETIVNQLIAARPIYISYEFGPVYKEFRFNIDHHVTEQGLLYRVSLEPPSPEAGIPDNYNLRSVMERPVPRTDYMKALSTAYIRSMQQRVRLLLLEGKREEAGKVAERIKEIRAEARSLWQETSSGHTDNSRHTQR